MDLSVVIPAYNYCQVLDRAISSVMRQAGVQFEVLVVNDGSTDETSTLLASWQRRLPVAFRYLEVPNSGPSAARNLGIEETSGEYLLFLDADDEMLEGALQRIRSAATTSVSPGIIVGGHISVRPGGVEYIRPRVALPLDPEDRFAAYVRGEYSLRPSYVAFQREVFDIIRFPLDIRHGEDQVVFGQVLAKYRCEVIEDPLVRVYVHDDSLGRNFDLALQTGYQVVDRLFDVAVLPSELLKYRKAYVARRALSLFRHSVRVRSRSNAIRFYLRALCADWRQCVRRRNTSKLLYSAPFLFNSHSTTRSSYPQVPIRARSTGSS